VERVSVSFPIRFAMSCKLYKYFPIVMLFQGFFMFLVEEGCHSVGVLISKEKGGRRMRVAFSFHHASLSMYFFYFYVFEACFRAAPGPP